MPDDPRKHLKHLRFTGKPLALQYAGTGGGKPPPIRRPDRAGHAAKLRQQLGDVEDAFVEIDAERQESDMAAGFGLVLTVSSYPDYPLAFLSLERAATKNLQGIELLNVQIDEKPKGKVTTAAIFVPFGRLDVLQKKVEAFADPAKDSEKKDGTKTAANMALLANIDEIAVAALDALWIDPEPMPRDAESRWWEMWVRREAKDGKNWEEQFIATCEEIGIEVPDQRLVMPDYVIFIAKATRPQLEGSLDLLNTLAEIRRPRACSLEFSDLPVPEQGEWIEEALERIEWPGGDAPAVCVIDTGAQRLHPLIEPLLEEEDSHTVFGDGDTSDWKNHGTPMCGIAAFGDLRPLLLSSAAWEQRHRLESVKLLDAVRAHESLNYGYVTQGAIALPEIEKPERRRVFCMAITEDHEHSLGRPSAWSSAIDSSTSGSQEEGRPRRVFLVSAGNCNVFDPSYRYMDTNREAPVQDPAQAWNAVSVGAYTERRNITEGDPESRLCVPVAPGGGLSPTSRTACEWEPSWPIKPEIVMEGGNLARHPTHGIDVRASLEDLAPSGKFQDAGGKPFTTMNATSGATAHAARLGGQLLADYPELSAESIRGLLVHSARWTEAMLNDGQLNPHRAGRTAAVEDLLRCYGYGAVDTERARFSFTNKATLVFEGSLSPYKGTAGSASFSECHILPLPWPKELLSENPDISVKMRVTLSHFIQPSPGSRSWRSNNKYRYASHKFGFAVKHKDMSSEDFQRKLEAQQKDAEQDEDIEVEAKRASRSLSDPGWALGPLLRKKAGSLVHDLWRGTTGQLAEMGEIAVFPQFSGWWAKRKFPEGHEHHNCHLQSVPYSLIVSIDTDADLPIYSTVEAAIIEQEIDVEA